MLQIIILNQEKFNVNEINDKVSVICKCKKIEKSLNMRDEICILVKRRMSEETNQEIYKVVKDITKEVKERAKRIFEDIPQIQILESKLLLGPDGWGSYAYFVYLRYEIDGIEHQVRQMIYAEINETLMHLLDNIRNYYERTHNIKL
jgi:hypothetical protein